MEGLSKAEKLVLGYLSIEYLGRMYLSTPSGEKPEHVIARVIAEDITSNERVLIKITPKLEEAVSKLKNQWAIEVSGYEAKLTVYGQQLASGLSKEELARLKEEAAQGKI